MAEATLINAALQEGFTVAAFLVAIIALWRSLRAAHKSQLKAQALEIAELKMMVNSCNEKHELCEERNRELYGALVAVASGRSGEALSLCEGMNFSKQ